MLYLIMFCLIVIDQAIKLLISNYFINVNTVLLPDILFFQPIQNTHLSWISSIFQYKTPVLLMIVIQIFGLIIMIILYRYLFYLWMKGKKLLYGMLLFFVSGIVCSFIDVVFWGGSLDFLRLFHWFTFDLKDVYLNVGTIFLLYYAANYYFKVYKKMSRLERKQTGMWIWIKKGMP